MQELQQCQVQSSGGLDVCAYGLQSCFSFLSLFYIFSSYFIDDVRRILYQFAVRFMLLKNMVNSYGLTRALGHLMVILYLYYTTIFIQACRPAIHGSHCSGALYCAGLANDLRLRSRDQYNVNNNINNTRRQSADRSRFNVPPLHCALSVSQTAVLDERCPLSLSLPDLSVTSAWRSRITYDRS